MIAPCSRGRASADIKQVSTCLHIFETIFLPSLLIESMLGHIARLGQGKIGGGTAVSG